MSADLLSWHSAWTNAASGSDGFYGAAGGLAEQHFATNVTTGPATASRIVDVAHQHLTDLLAVYDRITITDVGAGAGTLLTQVRTLLDDSIGQRVRWRAIDLRDRPRTLDAEVEWLQGDAVDAARSLSAVPGLVIAHELLDDLPCDVLEVDDDRRLRTVLVDPATGREALGAVVTADAWTDHWWPRREPAARVEVGSTRDEAWRVIAGTVSAGLAIAVDYGHTREERESGRWDAGTLTAYRDGRLVPVIPDGTRNITAHVAMDSCAASTSARSSLLEQSPDGLWWLVQEMGR